MEKPSKEPFDLNAFKVAKIKEREAKWDDFYDRYENMGEENSNEVVWDDEPVYSDDDVIYESDSESENESNDSEDEAIEDSEGSASASGDCIELSSDEEQNKAFEHVFKEFCSKGVETFQRNFEEHLLEETTLKDGAKKTVRRKTISNESGTKQMVTHTPIRSSNRISNALPNIRNLQAITGINDDNDDDGSRALVPFTGANSHCTDVMNMDDVVQNQSFQKNGYTYTQTVTKTIVTTTTMVMQPGPIANSTFDTPLKGDLSRPSDARRNRLFDSAPTFSDDFDEPFTTQETPTANRRSRRASKSSHSATSIYATPTRALRWQEHAVTTPKTPNQSSGAKSRRMIEACVSGKELVKSVPKAILDTPTVREHLKNRKIPIKDNEQLTVMCQPAAVPACDPDCDIIFGLMQNSPMPMVIKNRLMD